MTIYDDTLTDDAWREANFSPVQLDSAITTAGRQPTVAELIKAARRFGVEGVLESAIMLGQKGYKQVEDALRTIERKGGR